MIDPFGRPLSSLEEANILEALRELKLFVEGIPDGVSAQTLHTCASDIRGLAWTLMQTIGCSWNDSMLRHKVAGRPEPRRGQSPEDLLKELGLT